MAESTSQTHAQSRTYFDLYTRFCARFCAKSAHNLTWHIFDAFVRKFYAQNLTKSSKIKFIDFGVKS